VTTIAVIAAGAGGVETLRSGLIEPLLAEGHTVAITLTPTAGEWLRALGEVTRLEALTGLSVRDRSPLPGEPSPHPLIDVYVAAPMTANSTAKVALGIADNQAVTVLNENIGRDAPMILFPRVNAAHARHPAWSSHLARLRSAGVELVYGDHVWPLAEPRTAGERELPWAAILSAIKQHC